MASDDLFENNLHLFCMKIDNFENEIQGWDKLFESNTTRIYRKFNEGVRLYEYKILTCMPNVGPDVCYKVYMDIDYRKKWDTYVKELYAFREDGEDCIYWEVKYPFPATNRDYTYKLKSLEDDCNGKHMYVIYCKSFRSENIPVRKGVVRVADYKQVVVMTASDQETHGTSIYMEYVDNPGGALPSWLINWAAKSGAPEFLTATQNAVQGYSRYLEDQT